MIHLSYLSDFKWWNVVILPNIRQKSLFSKINSAARSVWDYQNRIEISPLNPVWCFKTNIRDAISIWTHYKKFKKIDFLAPQKLIKNWKWPIFQKISVRTKWLFYFKKHLDGPPRSPHIHCHHHSFLHVYHAFNFLKNGSKSPIFHVFIENHLST